MRTVWAAVPWFIAAPAVVVVSMGVAWFGYTYAGDLFAQTCTNEVNLLTGEAEESNCGDAPLVATTATATASPTAAATVETAAAGSSATATSAAPSATAAPSSPTAAAGPGVLARGMFRDGDPGHNGEGNAEVQRLPDGSLNVFLSGFSVTSGPDLFVVLSTSPDGYAGEGAIVLADLKANNGNQNYAIPAGTDLSRYRSVVIWCRQFNVDFAIATLEVE